MHVAMLDLNDYYYFVQAVENKGFSAASRALDLPKSTLSRRIIELEKRLGARLIQRNSRSFVMTDVGAAFHRHAVAMLAEVDAAENAVRQRTAEPSGTVRFTCSVGMASTMAALVCRFIERHPKVDLVQHATNRYVDLVEEGFDVGLRGHGAPLPDSSMVQRRVVRTPWALFASTAYLERHGTPAVPADLAAHRGLGLRSADDPAWKLHAADGRETAVAFSPRLRSDDIEALKAAALANLGIAALPEYLCRAEVESGSMRRLLHEWSVGKDSELTLLMPSQRGLLPSVRAFVEFIVTEYPRQIGVGIG